MGAASLGLGTVALAGTAVAPCLCVGFQLSPGVLWLWGGSRGPEAPSAGLC